MNAQALPAHAHDLIVNVLRRHPEIIDARLFGSRAKGNATPQSDVDIALWGDIDAIGAERVAAELDELPLPYRFDVKPFALIALPSLRAHIERVGVSLFADA